MAAVDFRDDSDDFLDMVHTESGYFTVDNPREG